MFYAMKLSDREMNTIFSQADYCNLASETGGWFIFVSLCLIEINPNMFIVRRIQVGFNGRKSLFDYVIMRDQKFFIFRNPQPS